VQGEINRQKPAQAGMLPAQLVAARLKQLDALEATIKAIFVRPSPSFQTPQISFLKSPLQSEL
jgi:hypothetical protein